MPTQCGGKEDKFGVSEVDIDEDPIKPGTTVQVTVTATPKVDITDGAELKFDIKLGSFSIHTEKRDICKDLGVDCPIPAGQETDFGVGIAITKAAPSVNVTAVVTGTNGDNSKISCLKIPLEVHK